MTDVAQEASLAFSASQTALLTGRIPTSSTTAVLGWYGPSYEATRGAFAVVNSTGPLAALAGAVVRITATETVGGPSVVCYCHATGDLFEDISITRRSYMELSSLLEDQINVKVEVLDEQ